VAAHSLEVSGRNVHVLDEGTGDPVLYLHGFADVHGVTESWLPFHQRIAQRTRLIAPAHPGCARSDENSDIEAVEDVVFHYLEVLDALGLKRFDLIGNCLGGWIAAELAVRHPEKLRKLVLIGALGLIVEGAPTGDIFMMAQPEYGSSYASLRQMLFASADAAEALAMFPDGKGDLEDELRRYQMLRLSSRIGFKPPYFYSYALRNRLHRIAAPALILWGENDGFVPTTHGALYAERIPDASLALIPGAGHSIAVEKPVETARLVLDFLFG
jgi:pimeloyl-ACP methyl ester carboxylesterase